MAVVLKALVCAEVGMDIVEEELVRVVRRRRTDPEVERLTPFDGRLALGALGLADLLGMTMGALPVVAFGPLG